MVRLGNLELPTDLVLAPMMDATTPTFRQLVKDLGGVGMVVTPMVFAQQIAQAPKTALPHLEFLESQHPCAVQIAASGRNEEVIKKSIDFLNSFNYDVLDINAGCPMGHTMRSGGGGSLLKDYNDNKNTERLQHLIEWSIKYSNKPVSVKTRLGFSNSTDILEISKLIEKSGALLLTLHGRTVGQQYNGDVNLELMRQVKVQMNIPVVGNGGVQDYITYRRMKDTTKCDAIMIGQAAMFDPALFNKIWKRNLDYSSKSLADLAQTPVDPLFVIENKTIEDIRKYLNQDLQYIEKASRFWNNDHFRMMELRRLAIWFIKGKKGYKRVREKMSKIMALQKLKDYVFGPEIEHDFEQYQE